jgi:DNA-binding MarR family transcriptional regulator
MKNYMAPPDEADELWSLAIELLLNARGWWMSLCSELDLTAAQGHALRALDPEKPVPMSALADALWCDASNVTGIVDKLESRGLIERQGADHDRRIKQLAVTEPGRRLRDRLNARVLEPPKAIASLPPEVKAHLIRTLRLLAAERAR